ncbi:hypothetical protein, partial [Sporomusa sp.]|uniref:hypothetical protein n=1 Tax=Sporomusa sp. TaxID=2078658 RepID=UPI002B6AC69C
MLKLIRNSKGSAGMLAIMAMLFLGIIGGAYATLSASNIATAARTRDDIAAQYLAEAGAQWALAYLPSHLADVPSNGSELSLPVVKRNSGTPTAGTYTVKVKKDQSDSSIFTIISTGHVNNSEINVILTVKAEGGNGGGDEGEANNAIFKYAAFAQNDMTLNNNAKIAGSIRTNTALNINANSVKVEGKAYYQTLGSNTLTNKSTVNDNIDNGNDLVKNTDTLTLDVDKLMKTIPSLTKSGSNLKTLIQNNANSGNT